MKKNESTESRKKLQLKKQAIANLSKPEMTHVQGGGEAAWLPSFGKCRGFLCCADKTQSIDIASKIIRDLIGQQIPDIQPEPEPFTLSFSDTESCMYQICPECSLKHYCHLLRKCHRASPVEKLFFLLRYLPWFLLCRGSRSR